MGANVFYISEGEMYMSSNGKIRPIPSAMLNSYLERVRDNAKRNDWKKSGSGAAFTGAYDPSVDPSTAIANAKQQSRVLCIGRHRTELVYSLYLGGASGIYRKRNLEDENEGVVLSDSEYVYNDFDIKQGRMVFSAIFANESHIGLTNVDGGEIEYITEGSTRESDPCFARDGSPYIYFSSLGLSQSDKDSDPEAPSSNGRFIDERMNGVDCIFGPAALCRFDCEKKELIDICSDEKYDFLNPYAAKNGDIYYIRRPYTETRSVSVKGCLLDVILLPFRLIRAIFGFFDVFSMAFSGKPLQSSGSTKSKQKDPRKTIVDGNIIDANKELKKNKESNDKFPGFIPHTWELHKLTSEGADTVVKRGVMAFALDESDGSVVYSNGSSIVRLFASGEEEKIADAKKVSKILL